MRPIWARGVGRGNRKLTNIWKNIKNAKVKMQNKKKRCFLNMGWFSQKSEGSTAGRLPRFNQQMWQKWHIKHSSKKSIKNGKVANHHRTNHVFKNTRSQRHKDYCPNGTRITVVSWKAGSRKGRSPYFGELGFWRLLGQKGRPKGAFLKILKIEDGTKIQLFIIGRRLDPLKTIPGRGFEKTLKNL